jgi:hypothetical protein
MSNAIPRVKNTEPPGEPETAVIDSSRRQQRIPEARVPSFPEDLAPVSRPPVSAPATISLSPTSGLPVLPDPADDEDGGKTAKLERELAPPSSATPIFSPRKEQTGFLRKRESLAPPPIMPPQVKWTLIGIGLVVLVLAVVLFKR